MVEAVHNLQGSKSHDHFRDTTATDCQAKLGLLRLQIMRHRQNQYPNRASSTNCSPTSGGVAVVCLALSKPMRVPGFARKWKTTPLTWLGSYRSLAADRRSSCTQRSLGM